MNDQSTPQRYFDAAIQRLDDALKLQSMAHWTGAAYLSGCAIEAMFWAFIPEGTIGERGRHDLQRLFTAGLGAKLDDVYFKRFRGGLAAPNPELANFEAQSREISRQIANATARWRNSYRYYPDAVIEA